MPVVTTYLQGLSPARKDDRATRHPSHGPDGGVSAVAGTGAGEDFEAEVARSVF
jgi:hypothetical protein